MHTRAYSTFEIKSVDEAEGIIRGIASTPSTDRMGDVVEPKGAQFKLPLPLLWQHDSRSPIGLVTEAKVTNKGIEVVAKISRGLTPDIDKAFHLIKGGLVRGLSIGFKGIDTEQIKDSWGVRYKLWEWLELSAVTIPANAEASIASVKSFDRSAASGAFHFAGVTAPPINLPKESTMNTATLRAMETERAAKLQQVTSLMEKSTAENRTLNLEEQKSYDTVRDEIKAIDAHMSRLKEFEQMQSGFTPVPQSQGDGAVKAASDARGAVITHQKKNDDIPGVAFARLAQCKALSYESMQKGAFKSAEQFAKELFRDDARIEMTLKAAVAAGNTTDGTWASPLVNASGAIAADFAEFLRPMSIVGRFGTGGIPSLRRVPFRLPLVGQTSGGAGYWVGEENAKPLTKFDFSSTNLVPLKVANIAVISMELARDSSPSAGIVVRDQMAQALAARWDVDFVDPAKAAVAGVSPASITNGLTPIVSSGNTADNVRRDVKAIMNPFINANNTPVNGVWIMNTSTALALSLLTNGLGQREFPGVTMRGGEFEGLPVITSEYLPRPSAGDYVLLANASDIYFADEGGINVDVSTEASLQMDNAPDNPTTASTVMVSLWQRNLVGFRAERTVNWKKRRTSAVALLGSVNWGE